MIGNQKVVDVISLCCIRWAHIYATHVISNRTISLLFDGRQCNRGYLAPPFNKFIFNAKLIRCHKVIMIDDSYQNIIKANNTSQNQLERISRFCYCNFGKFLNATIIFGEIFNCLIVGFGNTTEFPVSVCTAVSATFKVFINKAKIVDVCILSFSCEMKASR